MSEGASAITCNFIPIYWWGLVVFFGSKLLALTRPDRKLDAAVQEMDGFRTQSLTSPTRARFASVFIFFSFRNITLLKVIRAATSRFPQMRIINAKTIHAK